MAQILLKSKDNNNLLDVTVQNDIVRGTMQGLYLVKNDGTLWPIEDAKQTHSFPTDSAIVNFICGDNDELLVEFETYQIDKNE